MIAYAQPKGVLFENSTTAGAWGPGEHGAGTQRLAAAPLFFYGAATMASGKAPVSAVIWASSLPAVELSNV